ncbi:MAG: hypothetical protein MUC80_00505 [Candidatus Thermoplasmatota archaeon]|jgi:hypothetical protein|nr:hypothetical protein [Candidatus Thermoplasmatota archaeon]
MKTTFLLLTAIALLILFASIASAETRVMEQKLTDCESGQTIAGEVRQGEKIEVKISILVSEEKEISLYSELNEVSFYLGENRVTENNSVLLTLSPGVHEIRAVGYVPTIAEDQKEIILLSSDNLGKYYTARISSPYVLKDAAYAQIFAAGLVCMAMGGGAVFLTTRRKMSHLKAGATKKTAEKGEKIKSLVRTYLEAIAPKLDFTQKKAAKNMMKQLEELLRWQ